MGGTSEDSRVQVSSGSVDLEGEIGDSSETVGETGGGGVELHRKKRTKERDQERRTRGPNKKRSEERRLRRDRAQRGVPSLLAPS